jgi:hypothetical protein
VAVHITPLPHVAFTMLRNCWLRDRRISLKAKGLLGYLRSHAEGYRVSQAQILADSDDGRAAVRSALAELELAGYLRRTPTRSSGRFAEDDYALSDPFDLAGNLLRAETAPLPEAAGAETSQRRFSASDNPHRETAPLEDQGGEDQTLLPLPPPGGGRTPAPPDLFDEFWAAYPRHISRKDAERAWVKACKLADPDKIVAAVRAYPFETDPARRTFIPYPATWLNRQRWNDDPEEVAADLASRQDGRPRSEPYRNPPPGSYVMPESGRF